jgi:hypothetical protein
MVAGLFKKQCFIVIPSLSERVVITKSELDDGYYVITEDGISMETSFAKMTSEQIRQNYDIKNLDLINN